jgi:hypothetical protein
VLRLPKNLPSTFLNLGFQPSSGNQLSISLISGVTTEARYSIPFSPALGHQNHHERKTSIGDEVRCALQPLMAMAARSCARDHLRGVRCVGVQSAEPAGLVVWLPNFGHPLADRPAGRQVLQVLARPLPADHDDAVVTGARRRESSIEHL